MLSIVDLITIVGMSLASTLLDDRTDVGTLPLVSHRFTFPISAATGVAAAGGGH